MIAERKARRNDAHDQDVLRFLADGIVKPADQRAENEDRRVGKTVRKRIGDQQPVQIVDVRGEEQGGSAGEKRRDERHLIAVSTSKEKNERGE